MDIRSHLRQNILLFDGAMGTLWMERNRDADYSCELANLYRPESVLAIHRDYLSAGSRAIRSNTFGLNAVSLGGDHNLLRQAVTAGWELASQAAKEWDAFPFADVGPIPQVGEKGAWEAYREVLDLFLELGAVHFTIETHSSDQYLAQCAAYVKERRPEAFLLVTYAVQPDGYTRQGESGKLLLRRTAQLPQVDAVGLNCVSGAYHMRRLVKEWGPCGSLFAALPNGGYPIVVDNRTLYDSDPDYYALQLSELAGMGVRILGGCCGTTPTHIARAAALLAGKTPKAVRSIHMSPIPQAPASQSNRFWSKLERGKKVVAVELDPPKNAQLDTFLAGARALKEAGVDAITIADCPIGRARMDSSLLACKLRRELGIDTLPHMTCRDRNLNATKALLLGLSVEGVENVLVITGDPISSAERDEVKSVFNFNSRKLARFIRDLNETELTPPLRIFGALNVNARNFQVELDRAQEKIQAGITGFLTQPVLTHEGFLHLQEARDALNARILGGIIPVVSYRNACYMDSEINGIRVSQAVKDCYRDKDRAQCEALALEISLEIARRMAPYVDGYYLMTPFQRTGLMVRILEGIRRLSGREEE